MRDSEDSTIAYLALHLAALDEEFDRLRAVCGGLQNKNKYLVDLLNRCKAELQHLKPKDPTGLGITNSPSTPVMGTPPSSWIEGTQAVPDATGPSRRPME